MGRVTLYISPRDEEIVQRLKAEKVSLSRLFAEALRAEWKRRSKGKAKAKG